MRRQICNSINTQDRIPIVFFLVVGIVLIHHCVLLINQFKSIPSLEVHAWNSHHIIPHRRSSSLPIVTKTESVSSFPSIRKSQLNAAFQEDPNTSQSYDGPFHSISSKVQCTAASIFLGSTILCSTLSVTGTIQPEIANAYEDYISEPVQIAIKVVQDATTNDALVKAYENIAEIITEGKGVGGSINFQGVQLDRGYVSDEDTSIYNPGLTLLTETEKTRLVDTVVESKKRQVVRSGGSSDNTNSWNSDLEAGYSFLRDRLDPLHMYELRGYLSVLPIYGAVLYLVALAVQQLAREAFPIAYIVCAAAVFAPIILLVLLGPE